MTCFFFIVAGCALLALIGIVLIGGMHSEGTSLKKMRFDMVSAGTMHSTGESVSEYVCPRERYKAPDGTSVRKDKCFRGVVCGYGLRSFGLMNSDKVYGRSLAQTGGAAEYMRDKYVVFVGKRDTGDPFSKVMYDEPLVIRKCIGFVSIREGNDSVEVESDFSIPEGYTQENLTDAIRNTTDVVRPCVLVAAITGNRGDYTIELFDMKNVVAVIERTESQ